MKLTALSLVAVVTLTACCTSAAATPPGVEDSSETLADGTRTLRQSVIVTAPVSAVWQAFTTTEGYRSWAVPVARIDFRIGGIIEGSYAKDAKVGAPTNIRNEIVAYVPERMLAIRNRHAPPGVPFDAGTFQSLHTVMLFDAVGDDRTRVTIVQPGYLIGETYDRIWAFFQWGNGATLAAVRERFVAGPVDWSKAPSTN